MILNVYAVYDSKAKAYTQPWCHMTNASALRQFSDFVTTPNHAWNKHPEDYTLFCIGSFDDNNAVITPLKEHTTLGKAIEYVGSQS